MIKNAMLVTAFLAAVPAVAFAQVEDPPATTTAPTPPPTTSAPTAMSGESGSGPAIFAKGTMGLSFSFPEGGLGTFGEPVYLAGAPVMGVTPPALIAVPQINLQYFLDDKTAVDLLLGLAITDPNGLPATFGITVGAGYRMYKHNSAHIHTFLEPQVVVADLDLNNNGGASFGLAVAGMVGVEAMLTDWFSLRGQVGVGLSFTDKFNTITLGTGTSGLYANFYWN